VAERVKQLRQRRGWTAAQLAERCAEIGAPEITRSVIANIETGRKDSRGRRRREITVDESNILAFALQVPPAMLTVPLDGGDKLEVTPDVAMDPLTAASWLTGDHGYADSSGSATLARDPQATPWRTRFRAVSPEARPLALLREIGGLLDRADAIFQYGKLDDARVALREIGREIDRLGQWLESLGYTRPPLPAELAEVMRVPDGVPSEEESRRNAGST